jgi:hypothetical protein
MNLLNTYLRTDGIRSTILILLAASLANSCGTRTTAGPPATPDVSADYALNGQGMYSGHYSKGMLKLEINYISGNTVSGFDLHKGLRRNLNGHAEEKDGKLLFELHEPGHNPTDGTFYLTLDSAGWKITGKWVPTDPSKAKGGPVELKKVDAAWRRRVEEDVVPYSGDLGDLVFHNDGTCELRYYPTKDSNNADTDAQLITIRGNYEQTGDTIRIEWQYNTHVPALKMRLVSKPRVDGNDSTPPIPASLEGKGVKFSQDQDEGG